MSLWLERTGAHEDPYTAGSRGKKMNNDPSLEAKKMKVMAREISESQ